MDNADPPCCDMAIAMRDSVTVSIFDEMIGIASRIPFTNQVAVETSLRLRMAERLGTSKTSSKVKARFFPHYHLSDPFWVVLAFIIMHILNILRSSRFNFNMPKFSESHLLVNLNSG